MKKLFLVVVAFMSIETLRAASDQTDSIMGLRDIATLTSSSASIKPLFLAALPSHSASPASIKWSVASLVGMGLMGLLDISKLVVVQVTAQIMHQTAMSTIRSWASKNRPSRSSQSAAAELAEIDELIEAKLMKNPEWTKDLYAAQKLRMEMRGLDARIAMLGEELQDLRGLTDSPEKHARINEKSQERINARNRFNACKELCAPITARMNVMRAKTLEEILAEASDSPPDRLTAKERRKAARLERKKTLKQKKQATPADLTQKNPAFLGVPAPTSPFVQPIGP